jgi:hypothetical protein
MVLQRVTGPSVPEASAVRLAWKPDALLYRLLILNIVLQIFDGVATYAGLHIGMHEGNPLLRDAFQWWGVVPALLLFKAQACGLLVFVFRFAGARLAVFALALLAAVYCTFSLIPWLSLFGAFLLRFI